MNGNFQAWFRFFPLLLTGVALLYLIASLGTTVYHDFQALTQTDSNTRPGISDQGNPNTARLPIKAVVDLHLMGKAAPKPQPNTQIEKVTDTRLELILLGVFANSESEYASALIAEKGKAGKHFYVGDEVTGGALLETVRADAVILKRNGRKEALRFDKNSDFSSQKRRIFSARPISALDRNLANNKTIVPNPQTKPQPPADVLELTNKLRERIQRLRNQDNRTTERP